ncbi:hypothetical protein Bbelb_048780 [Branchiostoma belcheri]|nr:hypothetical protein Bbelb_048780 [Branchiostoma belcheri]
MRGGKAPEVEPNLVKLDADPAEWKAIRENFLFASQEKTPQEHQKPTKRDVTMENLQTFSWDDTVTWAEDLAPMSVGMLKALLPKVGHWAEVMRNYRVNNVATEDNRPEATCTVQELIVHDIEETLSEVPPTQDDEWLTISLTRLTMEDRQQLLGQRLSEKHICDQHLLIKEFPLVDDFRDTVILVSSCLPVPMHHIGDHWAVSCTQEIKTEVTVYGSMYTTVGMSLRIQLVSMYKHHVSVDEGILPVTVIRAQRQVVAESYVTAQEAEPVTGWQLQPVFLVQGCKCYPVSNTYALTLTMSEHMASLSQQEFDFATEEAIVGTTSGRRYRRGSSFYKESANPVPASCLMCQLQSRVPSPRAFCQLTPPPCLHLPTNTARQAQQQMGRGYIPPVAAQVPAAPVSASTKWYRKKKAIEEDQGQQRRKYMRKAGANICSIYGDLKEKLTCKICLERGLKVSFQCGHMFCQICATAMATCPACRVVVSRPASGVAGPKNHTNPCKPKCANCNVYVVLPEPPHTPDVFTSTPEMNIKQHGLAWRTIGHQPISNTNSRTQETLL